MPSSSRSGCWRLRGICARDPDRREARLNRLGTCRLASDRRGGSLQDAWTSRHRARGPAADPRWRRERRHARRAIGDRHRARTSLRPSVPRIKLRQTARAVAIEYGDGWVERVRAAAPHGVDAVLDTAGAGPARRRDRTRGRHSSCRDIADEPPSRSESGSPGPVPSHPRLDGTGKARGLVETGSSAARLADLSTHRRDQSPRRPRRTPLPRQNRPVSLSRSPPRQPTDHAPAPVAAGRASAADDGRRPEVGPAWSDLRAHPRTSGWTRALVASPSASRVRAARSAAATLG